MSDEVEKLVERSPRKAYQVAVVVFCEAEGVDEGDASAAAEIALRSTFRQASVKDQSLVKSSLAPTCAFCGLRPMEGLTSAGLMPAHVKGEDFEPESNELACDGSGALPREPQEPIVGVMRPHDQLPIYARVHEVMDAGKAAGNGFLWTKPTSKAFR